MKQIALGLIVLLLIIGGMTLLPVEYPQTDEDIHTGIEIVGPYDVLEVPEITLDIALPTYPEQVMVYKAVNANASKNDALEMAEKFGMSGPVDESRSGINYIIKDDPYTLEIEKKAGYMTYTWTGRYSGVDSRDRPENLPTDEEARKIAEMFLTSHDLMPEGAVYSGVTHGEGFFSDRANGTSIQTYKDTRVLFADRLSNLSVSGSGISVTVGGNGDILKVIRRWRETEPYREFTILSPKEAIEALKQTGIVTAVSEPTRATIDKMKLCYYASPPGDEQPYLKPTYYFSGTVEGEKGNGTFFQYIPAVPELGKGLY